MASAVDPAFLARLRHAVAVLGTQKEAAEKTGIPYATLQRIVAGKTDVGVRRLEMIADAAGMTVDDIMGATAGRVDQDKRSFAHFPVSAAPDINLVAVQEIDLKFGMGATELEVPVTSQVRHFSRDWIRQYTQASPDTLYFAQGIGDSMAPTISDNDLLLIDTSEQTLRLTDKIWAVAYSGAGMIKRLRPTRDGIQILSDNPLVPPDTAYDGELHILGRVVGIFRKM